MSMCDIIGIMKTWSDSNGALCAKLQLQCSTVDDLPSIDDVVGGFKTKPGTISQLIQANTFVTLDDNGTWYPEQETPEQASALNASPQLNMSPTVMRGDVNLTAQPLEEIEVPEVEPEEEETKEAKKPYFDLDGEYE